MVLASLPARLDGSMLEPQTVSQAPDDERQK
jgi:hypothetical protein